jgi:hypothetical protein
MLSDNALRRDWGDGKIHHAKPVIVVEYTTLAVIILDVLQ